MSSFHYWVRAVFSVFILLLFFACEKNINQVHVFSEFPIETNATNKKIIDQFGDNTFSRQLYIKENFIYLFDYEKTPYIRKFDLNFNFIDSLGLATDYNIDNPFFQHITPSGAFVFINESEYLSTYIKAEELTNQNSLTVQKEIEINSLIKADGVYQAFLFDDIIYLDSYYPKNGDIYVFNRTNNQKSKWIDFLHPIQKEVMDAYEDEFSYVLYRNKINSNHSNTRLVQVFSNFPSIQTFNSKGDREKYISYANPEIKVSNVKDVYANFLNKNNPSYVQYLSSFATNSKIYALYLNNTWVDILNYDYSTFEVHVFNWDLDPLEKIIVADHVDPMASFIVIENKREIIFLNPNQDNNYYTKWNF